MSENLIHWGGEGPVLHLAHANSFHPGVYKLMIEELIKHFSVYSFLLRPFHKNADPSDFKSWNALRDDLIEEADRNGWQNIIGVGHSLGSSVTMMVANKRPDIFGKLVVIEPPCIDLIFYALLDLFPYSIAKDFVPPSRIALKRRHKWLSREEAFLLLRPKKIFSKWSDETLKAYLQYGLEEDENGEFRLSFTKQWESKIYCTIKNPYKMFPKLEVPALSIRAEHTDVIKERNWKKWQRLHKNAAFVTVPGAGHLVPMEKPVELANMIIDFAVDRPLDR